ncbi:hypothetical protein NQ314_018902 [Rhamnusium bicolor]|uniref:Peptidoglycan-recognition protein n=1 Tax=Rhamnusium bicolor TaxID=1586634 RepID=A0AAV8WRY6_9CUCU|nr:hypothetical protein NQ314_018902 [Rhamnusium bicolor]
MHLYLTVLGAVYISMYCYVESACPQIISRRNWGARSPKRTTPLRTNPPPYVVVHHSDTPACTSRSACETRIRNIQTGHMNDRGWDDIGYNFLIGGDGNIYEGRGYGIHGSHVPKFNSRSIGICLIGDFQNTSPPNSQQQALKNLIDCAAETNKVARNYHVIGHRQGGTTTCPGNYLFNIIKTYPRWDSNPN